MSALLADALTTCQTALGVSLSPQISPNRFPQFQLAKRLKNSKRGLLVSRPSSLQVFSYFIGQELERNKPPELYLLGLADKTHSPTPEFLNRAGVRFGPPGTGGESDSSREHHDLGDLSPLVSGR